MASTNVNRLRCAVSAVASSGLGAFTVGAAASGFRGFGASHNGLQFDILVTEGTAWEVRTGCAYTHATTTLARGTLEDSSTGSAVAFTSAAVVTVTLTAAKGNRFEVSTSAAHYSLLSAGAVSDADLSVGSTSFGTDSTAAIQAVLDLASDTRPICVIVDGRFSVTGLRVKGNTEIRALAGCGLILRSGSNKTLLENYNFVFSGARTDKNIRILGGIWNGNAGASNANNIRANGTVGLVCGMRFYGVENLEIRDAQVLTPPSYAIHALNCKNYRADACTIDVGAGGVIHNDGIHADARCEDVVFRNLRVNSYDDGVAFNADDLYRDPANVTYPYYPATAAGAIKNVHVDGVVFSSSLFGARVLSGASRVDNIVLRNLRGYTTGYAVVVDNYWQAPSTVNVAGSGNIGTVEIDGIEVEITATAAGVKSACINLACNADRIVIRNFRRNWFATAVPSIYITGASTVIKSLVIEGFDSYDAASTQVVPHIVVEGALVEEMSVTRATLRRAGASNASCLVKTQSGGRITTLRMGQVSVDGAANIVNDAATGIGRVIASGVLHQNAGGGASFLTAGTVARITLSGFDGFTALSGTWTTQRGDAFITDATAPLATSAAVQNATPTAVVVQMNESMDATQVPAASAFTVSGHTVSAVAVSGSAITLTVNAFVGGEAARVVSYTAPGTNAARDLAGNLLASFTGLTITNNVTSAYFTGATPITFNNADGFLVDTNGIKSLTQAGVGTSYHNYLANGSTARLPANTTGSVIMACPAAGASAGHDTILAFSTSAAASLANSYAGLTFSGANARSVESGALGVITEAAVAGQFYKIERNGSTGAFTLSKAPAVNGAWTLIGTLGVNSTAQLYVVGLLYTDGVMPYPQGFGLTA